MKINILIAVFLIQVFAFNALAQNNNNDDYKFNQLVRLVPRFGIAQSQRTIVEAGFGMAFSKFNDNKSYGFNASNLIYYVGYETMTPFKKEFINGYKFGIEYNSMGPHSTNAGAIEFVYYTRGKNYSTAIIPKVGFPLFNGIISYGFAMFTNEDKIIRRVVGKHRFSVTMSINKKASKLLNAGIERAKNANYGRR